MHGFEIAETKQYILLRISKIISHSLPLIYHRPILNYITLDSRCRIWTKAKDRNEKCLTCHHPWMRWYGMCPDSVWAGQQGEFDLWFVCRVHCVGGSGLYSGLVGFLRHTHIHRQCDTRAITLSYFDHSFSSTVDHNNRGTGIVPVDWKEKIGRLPRLFWWVVRMMMNRLICSLVLSRGWIEELENVLHDGGTGWGEEFTFGSHTEMEFWSGKLDVIVEDGNEGYLCNHH